MGSLDIGQSFDDLSVAPTALLVLASPGQERELARNESGIIARSAGAARPNALSSARVVDARGVDSAAFPDGTRRDICKGRDMIRRMGWLAAWAAIVAISGCGTVAGGLIGTGVGIATGYPVSGALIGTGVGMMIDTAPRQ